MKSSIIIVLLLAMIISGCKVFSEFYLRNTTNEPKQITLISFENIQGKQFEFVYADSLFKVIQYSTYNYLDQKLHPTGNAKALTFSMPPNSTLHLGTGGNFEKLFHKMIIDTDTLDLNTTGGFQTDYERFSKYAVWYDIK